MAQRYRDMATSKLGAPSHCISANKSRLWRIRGQIASTLIAQMLVTTALAAEQTKPHNVLLFVADGLRPGMINGQTAPTIAALLKRGVTFNNSHSLFPTVTPPNAWAIATGHMPGDTGFFSDTIYTGLPAPGAGNSPAPFVKSDEVAGVVDQHVTGNSSNQDTILRAAAAANISTASIGKLGPILMLDRSDRATQQTLIVDDQTGHQGSMPLSAEMLVAMHEFGLAEVAPGRDDNGRAGDATQLGRLVANAAQQEWFTAVAALAALPILKERGKPFVMVFWLPDPDGTQHTQGDSPQHLIPGINSPISVAAIKNIDTSLAKLLYALDELGLATTTNVILASEYGLSTISKETATSYAATRSYPNVPPALLPPGFVSIDLAHGLRMSLFDADAPAKAKNTALADGSFPIRGNGILGDEASNPEVVVAANGGSDLIYLPTRDKLTAARIVQILSAQDYVSGIFVDSHLGTIAGTLPLSAIALEGSTPTPIPAIVVNFRSFSIGCAEPTACGVEVADTVLQQGQGTHGSFSRADTRNVAAAAGPDFRAGYDDAAPVNTADIGKTIATLLGLKLKDSGKLIGRVLTEALSNGIPVFAKAGVLKSSSDEVGRVTGLKYQTIGTTRYFDAAGYPGRTLGLD